MTLGGRLSQINAAYRGTSCGALCMVRKFTADPVAPPPLPTRYFASQTNVSLQMLINAADNPSIQCLTHKQHPRNPAKSTGLPGDIHRVTPKFPQRYPVCVPGKPTIGDHKLCLRNYEKSL
jgi:hypothetical protein